MYVKKLDIMGIRIPNNLWLAPLAGFSDRAMRIFCKERGAGFAVTEMVSVEGLVRGDKGTMRYLELETDGLVSLQLFGKNEPAKFTRAARIVLERTGIRIIDVNFGCPVRKVIKTGAGSSLLRTPAALTDIMKAVKDSGAVASGKVRSGFDKVNIGETIPALEKGGADIICYHPRLATQMYSGHADWELAAKARQLTGKPLFISGDVKTPEDARTLFERSGCDGIQIGRAAVGNPLLFSQIAEYDRSGAWHKPSWQEVKTLLLEFAALVVKESGEDSLRPIRAAMTHFIKGFSHAREMRAGLAAVKTLDGLKDLLSLYPDCPIS